MVTADDLAMATVEATVPAPRPLDVTIVSPGLPHDGTTLRHRSLGGSESAAIHVAAALAKQGHRVTAFSPGHQGVVADGVQWLPIEQAGGYLRVAPHDVCLVSRDATIAAMPNAAGLTVLWCHDLATKRQAPAFVSALWQVGAVYVLSEYQRRQVLSIHGALEPVLHRTQNGIAPWQYEAIGTEQPRDPWKLVYGSRPERGLETCLAVMDRCAARGLPWHLVVAGYDNTTPQMRPYYESLWAACERAPNVRLAGPLPQEAWHREIATAWGLMYPGCSGPFREISCLVVREAMVLGTPVVAVAKGAIPETLHPDAGVLVGDDDVDPLEPPALEAFVAALGTLADDAAWARMHVAGPQAIRDRRDTWDDVVASWVVDWRERLALRRANPWSVTRALHRAGDHEALEAVS